MTQREFTNIERANRAEADMKEYSCDWNAITNAVDFLTDLQHFYAVAHAKDISHPTFDEALKSARVRFEAEQKGEEL
jgi:hypothetical protein